MKKAYLFFVTVVLSLAFSSCLNLDNDSDYVVNYMCMATVTTGGAHPIFQMDEGFYLAPEDPQPVDTFLVGERYFLHFVMGDTTNHPRNTYPIGFNRYDKTTIKSLAVLQKDSVDKWGNKPITMSNLWSSGHYFNFFFLSYAGTGKPNTFELIRLKASEKNTSTDTVPKLYFELRHNVGSASTTFLYYQFYSFDLSSLAADFPNAIRYTINVSWNDIDKGTKSYIEDYTPNTILTNPLLKSADKSRTSFISKPF